MAVQACMLSKLASDSLKMLRDKVQTKFEDDEKSMDLLHLVEDTNKMMINYFCDSQSSINKITSENMPKPSMDLFYKL